MLLLFALLASVAWLLLAFNIIAVVLAFSVGAALVVLQFVDRRGLLCPHCHESPISVLQRGTAENADFCVHCHYWLKNPRGEKPV